MLWKEYFEELLNGEEKQKTEVTETYVDTNTENQDVEFEGLQNLVKVKEIIKELKNKEPSK